MEPARPKTACWAICFLVRGAFGVKRATKLPPRLPRRDGVARDRPGQPAETAGASAGLGPDGGADRFSSFCRMRREGLIPKRVVSDFQRRTSVTSARPRRPAGVTGLLRERAVERDGG
ncbi:hypothetical protein AAFF_G00352550 [Aldrovandia affinis]|uniref:Secreted protein n=1 Tax=Aldrovandia affinis TaxID=143900 RepID=A0AAD7WNR8_9TELE|nr:hypothetical protein AAFF_G00352550 [Aldrovandia affinis]